MSRQQDIETLINELKQLKIRELRVLEALETTLQQQTNGATQTTTVDPNNCSPYFKIGDRIAIKNKIIRPVNRPLNRGDRTATVTKATLERIEFRTTNGTETWRAPHNVRKLDHDE
jgi:hypothetical protein